MQCSSFRLNIRSSGSSVSCESRRLNSTCLAQKSGREKGSEERRPGARGRSCDRYMGAGGAVLLREAEMFVIFQWHDGSEGSGDGVSPPRPQAERLPGRRVQLLARQSALLTCGEGGQR